MKRQTALLFFFLIFSNCETILAGTVGTLFLEKGVIKIRRNLIDSIYQQAGQKITVYNKDEIQTGPKTHVKINLTSQNDDIELFSHTFFTLSGISENKSEMFLAIGKSRFHVKKPKIVRKNFRKRRFRIRTTNAIIGVKGTDFVLGVIDGNTSLFTITGVVSLANAAEPEIEVEVGANQVSKIDQNQRPTIPVLVPLKERSNIINSDSAKIFESIQFGATTESIAPSKKKTDKTSAQNIAEKKVDQETMVEERPEEIDIKIDELIENSEEEIEEKQEDIEEAISQQKKIKFRIIER